MISIDTKRQFLERRDQGQRLTTIARALRISRYKVKILSRLYRSGALRREVDLATLTPAGRQVQSLLNNVVGQLGQPETLQGLSPKALADLAAQILKLQASIAKSTPAPAEPDELDEIWNVVMTDTGKRQARMGA